MCGENEAAAVGRCSEVLLAARTDFQDRTKKELAEMPRGSKCWWKKSRELLMQKSTAATIPALRKSESAEWWRSTHSKADLLADTFCEKNVLAPSGYEVPIEVDMEIEAQGWDPSTMISQDDVASQLRALREESATGPDLIPTRVLKWCEKTLAVPVHKLLMRLSDEGQWPAVWITHWIVPIYKRSAAWSPKNYRWGHT